MALWDMSYAFFFFPLFKRNQRRLSIWFVPDCPFFMIDKSLRTILSSCSSLLLDTSREIFDLSEWKMHTYE